MNLCARVFISSLLILSTVYSQQDASSISTLVQLKHSVSFSYSWTNSFLDLIRGDSPPTSLLDTYAEIMSSRDRRISFRTMQPVVASYAGFGICVAVGILFVILMPIVGLIFCCARCCGKCGGRVKLMDSKRDPCKRIAYTICVVLLVTMQLMAIVLVFVNHFLFHEAMINRDLKVGAFPQLNLSLFETEQSLKHMFSMAINASSVDLNDRKSRFFKIVDNGLMEFQRNFIYESKAEKVFMPIVELQRTMEEFASDTQAVHTLKRFNKSLVELIHQLPTIRNGLMETLDSNCPFELHLKCTTLMHRAQTELEVRYTINQFQTEDIAAVLDQIQSHLIDVHSLNEFNTTITKLATTARKSVEDELDRAWTDLAYSPDTRENLAGTFQVYLEEIYRALRAVRSYLHSDSGIQNNETFVRIMEFRLYGLIALLCIPVLIFLLIYLGLCFGTCGQRPYEEAGVCNRGVGANLLLAAVGFVFLFSSLLMIVCTILFLFGAPLQTEACRYLTGRIPDGPRKLDDMFHESLRMLIDRVRRDTKLIQQQQQQPVYTPNSDRTVITHNDDMQTLELIKNFSQTRILDAILTRCRNEPFVDAISGGQLTWPVLYQPIQSILQDLINSFMKINLVSPLEDTVRSCSQVLDRLRFLDAINLSKAINQASVPLTHIGDLDNFASELRSLRVPQLYPHIDALTEYAVLLDNTRNLVRQLFSKLDSLPGQRQHLQRQFSLFSDSLPTAINLTMNNGVKSLRPVFERELQLAVIATWRDIPCTFLHNAAQRGVDAVCVTFLMPMNTFWAGLGFTLLMFIPLAIFAVKLAGLYRKTEKYSSDYDEPDYISYHGFYMRPTSDYRVMPQKAKKSERQHKDKDTENSCKKRGPGRNRAHLHSRYQPVSVYPYDAYE